MIEFIGGAVVLCCVIGVIFYVISRMSTADKSEGKTTPLTRLAEGDLVKKFNSLADLLGHPGKRDLDSIAKELMAVLKEYKCRKVEQFVESTQLLTKNKNHINEQIGKLNSQITKLTADAKALKKDNMTDSDIENGALYMAQIAETEKLKEQLIKTAQENDKRLEYVEKQVKNFNTKYTLKEVSISNMIVMAKTTKNISTIDLHLNDLISEFKDKVQDAEIEYQVKSQINGTADEESDTTPEFEANKDKYVDEFKKLIG